MRAAVLHPENAASVSFDLGLQDYSKERGRQFREHLLKTVEAMPEIESASLSNTIPLSLDVSRTGVRAYRTPGTKASDLINAIFYYGAPTSFIRCRLGFWRARFYSARCGEFAARSDH
jgi:hypothetical protein